MHEPGQAEESLVANRLSQLNRLLAFSARLCGAPASVGLHPSSSMPEMLASWVPSALQKKD